MTSLRPSLMKVALAVLAVSSCLIANASAQKRQALVIMRAGGGGASVAQCDGAAEINYQLIAEPKLNSKEEVRMAGALGGAGASTSVSRKAYEETHKTKMRDLFQLKWGADGGVLYAVSLEGQTPVAVIPDDTKPQKDADQPLSSFYSVMLTGEAREGKSKRQVSVPLRDVLKIYFVPEGAPVGDTLFKHAAEEKSVVLWEAYLRKTNNYRQGEANNYMRDALVTCARADLDSFRGGDYGSLDKARLRAERAQSVRGDALTQQLVADITQAQQKVDAARSQADALIRASKFDEAIDAAEQIKIYLSTWPALKEMYGVALQRSHEQHLSSGETALDAGQLDKALSECTLAWKRVDSADARGCTCKSRDRVALRDQKNLRLQRRPKDAKELLDARVADGECPRDGEVAKELEGAKCEYAQQLLAESRRLVGAGGGATVAFVPASAPAPQRQGRRRGGRTPAQPAAPPKPTFAGVKAINAQNKKDFREAREKLVLASELCQDDGVRALLSNVNRSLSGYCMAEAQKAVQRGDAGTAYVYLTTAQGYTPDDQNVTGLLSSAREEFGERTRVNVGVAFSERGGGGEQIVSEVATEVESAAARAGLAQPVILDRRQAAQYLQAIQAGRAPGGPTVIFYGDLLSANAQRSEDPRQMRGSFQRENPYWKEADRIHDARNEVLKRCRKQPGADCSGLEADVAQLKANRDRYERYVTEYYTYTENHIRVTGDLRLSFRSIDSVSRSTRDADMLEAAVSRECVARDGVRQEDYSIRNQRCDELGDAGLYMRQMIEQVKGGAQQRALSQLSQLPLSYYARARTSANRQQAVEDYLRFIFLTRDKGSAEVQEAQRTLVAYDPELKTDGVMR
ncbi:MAG: hypothetical protein JOZ02_02420 [Acidobacteria bacterium]|nr:hypothetical protein [Acidobacteriota bacterium]